MKTFGAAAAFLFTMSQGVNAFVFPSSTRLSTKLQSTEAPQQIKIAKYEGLGNDFILVDARNSIDPPLTPGLLMKESL